MFGSRGMHRDILVWRDLPDDGRYVIGLPNENPVATPMSRADLVDAALRVRRIAVGRDNSVRIRFHGVHGGSCRSRPS
ncbi:hypothetical protein ACWDNR_23850, partial [Gordonia aichiensis]